MVLLCNFGKISTAVKSVAMSNTDCQSTVPLSVGPTNSQTANLLAREFCLWSGLTAAAT